MAQPPDLSGVVRAKVKNWLKLQPRGTQTRMAEYVGVKSPALSNYLRGRRRSMRADNIGRIVDYLRLHAPELNIDVQESVGASGPVTPVRSQSASNETPGDADGTEISSLRSEIAELRRQLAEHVEALRTTTDGIAKLAHREDAFGQLPKARTRKPKRG